MIRDNKFRIKKITVFISAMLLMLLLCGCRTRITNNTEVVNVLENGDFMQESYQVRRDELGIPVAETPLFTGWESDSEEYDDYDYYDEFEGFDDEEYDDEDDTSDTRRKTDTTPANREQSQPVRRPAQTETEAIKVTLDVNAKDAKCSAAYVMIRKGSVYGTLPEPSRSGYSFKGWYTAKKDGDKVTSKTKLKSDKAHTLYAHWKKAEKKTYTITFDGNGGDDEVTLSSTEMTVEEGGKYGDMPSAKRKKYNFSGWFTDPEDGSQVTGGSKFTGKENQTLYAHWEYDPYTWWDSEFKTASNSIDDAAKVGCIIDGSDDTEEDFVNECKGGSTTDGTAPGFIIKFVKNYSDETAATEAEELYSKYRDTAPGAKVVIISDKALKGSKEERLLYKMMLFDALYKSSDESTDAADDTNINNINEAAGDLLDTENAVYYPYIYSGGSYEEPSDGTIDDSSIETIDDSGTEPVDDSGTEPINDSAIETIEDSSAETSADQP